MKLKRRSPFQGFLSISIEHSEYTISELYYES